VIGCKLYLMILFDEFTRERLARVDCRTELEPLRAE
jgi:hypothetical protein